MTYGRHPYARGEGKPNRLRLSANLSTLGYKRLAETITLPWTRAPIKTVGCPPMKKMNSNRLPSQQCGDLQYEEEQE